MSRHRGTRLRPRYARMGAAGASLAVTLVAVMGGFTVSLCLTAAMLFGVGAWRTRFTGRSGWRSGFEMLFVGVLTGAFAFAAGWVVDAVVRRR